MIEAWRELSARGPGWYWMGQHARNGDLYHACSLLEAFRRKHGWRLPIYMIVGNRMQANVASIFKDYFAEIIVAPPLPAEPEAWVEFYRQTGLPTFGPDTPIVIHPSSSPETYRLGQFAIQNRITWMQLYKLILNVDADEEPAAPPTSPELEAQARLLCEHNGMLKGRTVLFFPYAQSFPIGAALHFERLGEALSARGYTVLTSVAGDEAPIPGTRPVFIPFDLLIDAAEYAGWAVAIRSGICDILAPSRCRKSFIYRSASETPLWGVKPMGLCRDALELPFDFHSQGPETFCSVILADEPFEKAVTLPTGLSASVGAGGAPASVSSFTFSRLQQNLDNLSALLAMADELRADGVRALRLFDLPAREHPRWKALADTVLSSLCDRLQGAEVRFYVCRDHSGSDFFEEVNGAALVEGLYTAAGYWHTLVMASHAGLEAVTSPGAVDHIMALDAVATGETIPLAAAWASPDYVAHVNGLRPIRHAGLQLLDGWYMPEPWGVWSRGRRTSLKFALSSPACGAFSIEIGFVTTLTEHFRRLEASVRVNGRPITTEVWEHGRVVRPLRIEVPAEVARRSRAFLVEWELSEVRSPKQQGTSEDGRMLGLGVQWVRVDAPMAVDSAYEAQGA